MEVLEIKKKLENIQDMPETEEKQTLLEAMSMTQTWLNLEDLKQILPKEKYVDIETKLKEVLEKQITEKEGWTKFKIYFQSFILSYKLRKITRENRKFKKETYGKRVLFSCKR